MWSSAIDRHAQRVARIAEGGINIAALPDALLEVFEDAVGFDGICAGAVDPLALVPTAVGRVGATGVTIGGVDLSEALALTQTPGQWRQMRELTRARHPAAVLARDPAQSEVWERLHEPCGVQHSLISLLVADGVCYGFVNFLRGPSRGGFGVEHIAAATAMGAHLARAARAAITHPRPRADEMPRRGVLVLDATLAITSGNAEATRLLAELPHDGGVCPAVHATAARALAEDGETQVWTRVRCRSGVWMKVSASRLVPTPEGDMRAGAVAVVIEPASAGELAALLGTAYGLTRRELEVAIHVIAGRTTPNVARTLGISFHTANDHVRAVFRKVSVRSRYELAAALGRGI